MDPNDIVFDTLEEWNAYPYKYDIMIQVYEFMNSLHKLSDFKLKYLYGVGRHLGMFPKDIILPIYHNDSTYSIERLVNDIKGAIYGEECVYINEKLLKTDMGYKLCHELCSTVFTDNVFCHNYLRYDSFIVNNNKLVGIKNWDYCGYYPKEFEIIIQRYLEFI
jgi:hypothetical protein